MAIVGAQLTSRMWPMQQGKKDELRQIFMGKDELRETLLVSLEHVVLCTNTAMRSATEVLM